MQKTIHYTFVHWISLEQKSLDLRKKIKSMEEGLKEAQKEKEVKQNEEVKTLQSFQDSIQSQNQLLYKS